MDRFRSPTSRMMMMMRAVGYMIISQKTGIIITSFSYVSSCSTFCLSATIRIGFKTHMIRNTGQKFKRYQNTSLKLNNAAKVFVDGIN